MEEMSLIKPAPASGLQNYIFGALFTVCFQISFMSRTCDLHDSRGVNVNVNVNVATHLCDNLWRDIKKSKAAVKNQVQIWLETKISEHYHFIKLVQS